MSELNDSGQPPGDRAKRRRNGRRRRKPGVGLGLVPPVIRVEIQNLEQLGRERDVEADERAARLAAAEAQLEERAARFASLEADLAERERRVADLEAELQPIAGMFESRERIDRTVNELKEERDAVRQLELV